MVKSEDSSSSVTASQRELYHQMRLKLLWCPKWDGSTSSPVLLQIMRKARFDDGFIARMLALDEYYVIIDESTCNFFARENDSCH